MYINYQRFRTVKFRTIKYRTLKFGQKMRYFGRLRTNISDKTFSKIALFSPYFWHFCLDLAAAIESSGVTLYPFSTNFYQDHKSLLENEEELRIF